MPCFTGRSTTSHDSGPEPRQIVSVARCRGGGAVGPGCQQGAPQARRQRDTGPLRSCGGVAQRLVAAHLTLLSRPGDADEMQPTIDLGASVGGQPGLPGRACSGSTWPWTGGIVNVRGQQRLVHQYLTKQCPRFHPRSSALRPRRPTHIRHRRMCLGGGTGWACQ